MSGSKDIRLVEGVDYYFEKGLMVFTAYFLARRGFCCNNGCRHCPYGDNPPSAPAIRILGVDPGNDDG